MRPCLFRTQQMRRNFFFAKNVKMIQFSHILQLIFVTVKLKMNEILLFSFFFVSLNNDTNFVPLSVRSNFPLACFFLIDSSCHANKIHRIMFLFFTLTEWILWRFSRRKLTLNLRYLFATDLPFYVFFLISSGNVVRNFVKTARQTFSFFSELSSKSNRHKTRQF